MYKDICAACGTDNIECYPVASVFGAYTSSICKKCIEEGRFPYWSMVNYIAFAGRYPDDINETYRNIVTEQLKLYNKTEEQFINDVNDVIADIETAYEQTTFASYDDKFDDFEGDFF